MNQLLHIVCPRCAAVNRLPAARLGANPVCGRCRQALFNGQPLAVDEAAFDTHLSRNDIPVLVDFWAPWCGPCRMMAPHFVEAAATLEPGMRLLKVDTEAEPALGSRFSIRSIPTLALFRGGREVARQAGAMHAPGIVQWARDNGR